MGIGEPPALGGKPVDAKRNYVVAGWASVQETPAGDTGRPVWDMVAEYLRDKKTIKSVELNKPKINGIKDNPGLSL